MHSPGPDGPNSDAPARLSQVSRQLSRALQPVAHGAAPYVYDPTAYARSPHELYIRRFGRAPKPVLFLGMNPGPFGMAQTGVPFGDPKMVEEFLGIRAPVGKPPREHPKRPVLGFASPRREVSGTRLWGWIRQRFGTPQRFFASRMVWNYCPLLFLEESGRNRTPDKLPKHVRQELFRLCDRALAQVCDILGVETIVAVGRFAEERARAALGGRVQVLTIPHPSPANPAANADWAGQVEAILAPSGVLQS